MHAALLESFEENATLWNGHRVFAVDGRTFNLPPLPFPTLQPDGFKRPSPNAATPQGLVSCLYRLQDKLPYDVDLAPGGDERTLARHHSHLLKPEDIVVYDRGYVSRALLAHPIDQDLHAVFRIRRKADTQVDPIMRRDHPDTCLTLTAKTSDTEPRRIRVVKARHSDWVLVTTLTDAQTYPPHVLTDLYHQRGSIEELYKTIKQTLAMEAFSDSPCPEPARCAAGTHRRDDPHRPRAHDVK